MARLEGFEPPTSWFVAKHSNPTELQAHLFNAQGQYFLPLVICCLLEDTSIKLFPFNTTEIF